MVADNTLRVEDILRRFPSPVFLGGGGQKQVYRVDHPEHGAVVVKIGSCRSAQELERIQREVDLLCDLDSPYFPKQFAFERWDSQRFCIVEQCVPGQPLTELLDRIADEAAALGLLRQLICGMSLLWSRRVVHRDLKPANIMIAEDHPRIIDLGIARVLDGTSLTMSHAPFGPCTPNYASPEQLTNRKRDIDHRSDQFILGIDIAQILLGGVHPFDPHGVRQGASIPENIFNGRWCRDTLRQRCASSTYTLLERMLGHHPYQRFRRHEDLAQALSALNEG